MCTKVGKRCVLLVEDDPHSRYIYEVFLEREGFRVMTAGGGREGIRIAREERPDVILMDISIPDTDGWSATRLLKSHEETSSIPVIALTAHAFASDRETAREVGCDGFVAKPCHPRKLLDEILSIIGT